MFTLGHDDGCPMGVRDSASEQEARALAPCRCGVGEFSEPGRDPRVHASQCPVRLRDGIAAAFARAEARLAKAEHERDEARRLHRQNFYLACARVTLARRTRERDEARRRLHALEDGLEQWRAAAERVRQIDEAPRRW